ncbi:hypothetical protein KFE25_013859 [Diacronema lutheri]|uniref:Uncharacterized protein n=2 Tax=Diacronema lutheri TaxID=2081491 RepID=A0A8J6C9Q3_DIALT|nr:hypothetical protein KFE25_013859 [Diacronema lutheri]
MATRTAPTLATHFLPHKIAPILWRMPRAPAAVAEDYVLAWPSSTVPKRGRPSVGAHYSLDVHPSSSSACPRTAVIADYDFPVELISSRPAAVARRRRRPAMTHAPPTDGAAWPVSPPARDTAIDDSYVYEWPSALAVRAARACIVDESYIYEWPSSVPMLTKPDPTHVMTWVARA